MKRREFLGALGGAAAAWLVVARAQHFLPHIRNTDIRSYVAITRSGLACAVAQIAPHVYGFAGAGSIPKTLKSSRSEASSSSSVISSIADAVLRSRSSDILNAWRSS